MRKHVKRNSQNDTTNVLHNQGPSSHSDVNNADEHDVLGHRAESPRSFLRRLSDNLSFMKYVIVGLLVPPILNLAALRQEAIALAPQGHKVDMGWGQKMFIHCEGHGLPTVIFDAPTGMSSDIWYFVRQHLARVTKVCIYDRSGIGSSDAAFTDVSKESRFDINQRFEAQASTLKQMTKDLHFLITEVHPVPRPVLLVGAEVGALIARMYSLFHPEDISGLVLVDPLVENLLTDSDDWKEYWYSRLLPSYESLHLSAMMGISRIGILLGMLQPIYFRDNVPENALQRQKSLLCNPWHINAAFQEYLAMNASFLQMSATWENSEFPEHVSVSVITRDRPQEFPSNLHEVWKRSQDHLVNHLHKNCQHKIVGNDVFLDLYSNPSPVATEVERMVSLWRRNSDPSHLFAQ